MDDEERRARKTGLLVHVFIGVFKNPNKLLFLYEIHLIILTLLSPVGICVYLVEKPYLSSAQAVCDLKAGRVSRPPSLPVVVIVNHKVKLLKNT